MSVEDDEKNVWPEPKELIDGCAVVDDREERKKDRRPIPYSTNRRNSHLHVVQICMVASVTL
jgi:hypothetical protein